MKNHGCVAVGSILDAECRYADGQFHLGRLPTCLPPLFTARFTADQDFAAGDVLVVKGRVFPIKTRTMEDPESLLFAAGAVVQCDVDMERGLAFMLTGEEPEKCVCPFQHEDLVYFIHPSGDNSLETPGTADAPFKSLMGAMSAVSQRIIPTVAGNITYLVSPAEYPAEPMDISLHNWPKTVFIESAESTAIPVLNAGGAFSVTGGKLVMKGMAILTDTGFISTFSDITLDSCAIFARQQADGLIKASRNSYIKYLHTLLLDGGGVKHIAILATDHGMHWFENVAITMQNCPEVTHTLHSWWNSSIWLRGSTITGDTVGKRYNIGAGSNIYFGQEPNLIPGTVDGTTAYGGVFI